MSDQQAKSNIYTVARPAPKLRAGQGLLAGLGVVMSHFRNAFGKKLDNPGKLEGVFTVQYPEERRTLPQAFRNFPILLYDDATGHELCTSCFQCQRICPPQVIHMAQEKDPATGKPLPAVAEFIIEYDACMSCGLCAEVCPFDAIKMDQEFELATDLHHGLTIDKVALNRPVSYYAQIAPDFWAEVKESAEKKLQGNIKRRSGLIGIAPQVAEKVRQAGGAGDARDRRQETGEGRQETGDRRQETGEGRQQTADSRQQTGGEHSAGQGDQERGGQEASAGELTVAPDTTAPVTDKAARLAAIRARNAAKKTSEAGEQREQTEDTPRETGADQAGGSA